MTRLKNGYCVGGAGVLTPAALVGFFLGLLMSAGTLALAKDSTSDAKRIQGTWVIDPATYKDIKDKEAVKAAKDVRIIFEGDTVTFKHPPGNEERVKFVLDATKKPKQIDMSEGAKGIYELDGDTLKLCWDQQAKTNGRPTRFADVKDKPSVHNLGLKREKK
jgi:uncharacterized protein (TIGR03067 family)